MSDPSEADRDRAAQLGRLAARSRRRDCPYNANGDAEQRQLALVYVRAFIAAGGDRPAAPAGKKAGGAGGTFAHIGMPV